jgi:hypothetical protein
MEINNRSAALLGNQNSRKAGVERMQTELILPCHVRDFLSSQKQGNGKRMSPADVACQLVRAETGAAGPGPRAQSKSNLRHDRNDAQRPVGMLIGRQLPSKPGKDLIAITLRLPLDVRNYLDAQYHPTGKPMSVSAVIVKLVRAKSKTLAVEGSLPMPAAKLHYLH